jgi:hypothetical protein
MIKDEASPLVVDIARAFISLVMSIQAEEDETEIKASVRSGAGVQIIDVLKHKDFFHRATATGRALLQSLEKEKGLFLLIVDASFDYEIKFEHEDMDRWKISKCDGGTGVPTGLESETR